MSNQGPDHWADLASLLGAEVPPEPEPAALPEKSEIEAVEPAAEPCGPDAASPVPEPPRRKRDSAHPTPPSQQTASDWLRLAASLGIEVPEPIEEIPPETVQTIDVEAPAAEEPYEEVVFVESADDADEYVELEVVFNEDESAEAFVEITEENLEDDADGFASGLVLESTVGPFETGAPVEEEDRPKKRRKRRRRGRRDRPTGAALEEEPVELIEEALEETSEVMAEELESLGSEESEEESEAPSRRRRRRRPKRKGRRGEDESAEGDVDMDYDAAADVEDRAMEHDEDQADDEDFEGDKPVHRGIPTWEEAVGLVVTRNLEVRSKNPGGGSWSRGSRGRGGRDRSR